MRARAFAAAMADAGPVAAAFSVDIEGASSAGRRWSPACSSEAVRLRSVHFDDSDDCSAICAAGGKRARVVAAALAGAGTAVGATSVGMDGVGSGGRSLSPATRSEAVISRFTCPDDFDG